MSEKNSEEGELKKRARYLDADIHRELTIEQAQKELSVWSQDKIEPEDVYLKLSDVEDAKRDFAKISEKTKETYDKTAYLSHSYGMDLKEVNARLQIHNLELLRKFTKEWFLKWFGEVKKE